MNTTELNGSILIVEPNQESLTQLTQLIEPVGLNVTIVQSGEQALDVIEKWQPDIILLNSRLPGIDGFETCSRLKQHQAVQMVPIFLIVAMTECIDHSQILAVGSVGYLIKPFQGEEVLMRIHVHIAQFRQQKTLQQQNELLRQQIRSQIKNARSTADAKFGYQAKAQPSDMFIGKSGPILKILNDIRRLQNSKITVLIEGECGTGKERVANAIHKNSLYANGPFVAVNCSAIPYELAESEFFGSMRGAFTGALKDRKGYFELAEGGTLFLDEIGEMPQLLQAKLLRALEERKIRPVGGTHPKPINIRVIAATNAHLLEMIKAGTFRWDLYFRLVGCLLTIPPLRTRKEDIALLARHFLNQLAADMETATKEFSPHAFQALENYDFPGNVRELKNIIERAWFYCDEQTIQPEHLNLIETGLTSETQSPSRQTSTDAIKSIQAEQSFTTDEEKILTFVQRLGYINNVLCQQLLGINHNRATYLLKKMIDNGVFVCEGSNRATRYCLPQPTQDTAR
jgi:DNA-binding NtrC family response regulator